MQKWAEAHLELLSRSVGPLAADFFQAATDEVELFFGELTDFNFFFVQLLDLFVHLISLNG
jgi:hypothetical protein